VPAIPAYHLAIVQRALITTHGMGIRIVAYRLRHLRQRHVVLKHLALLALVARLICLIVSDRKVHIEELTTSIPFQGVLN